ncbi:MAG: helix-turn-helix domain-containing protein [Candidatus Kapabacteria bacterium]|jgi:AraC-like DNA-binding protein|nr:helix-turn-helix domain-containing protein [Candidatus Kapabacteria bacterium]
MTVRKHIPKEPLQNYVESILYLAGNNIGAGLPKTNMSLVFNLGDSFKLFTDHTFTSFTDYKQYWLAGLQVQPRFVESYGQSSMIVVQFRTIGAYMLLGEALHQFSNEYIPLDAVFCPRDAEETWLQLKETSAVEVKFLITENFLYRKLLTAQTPHQDLLQSINTFLQKPSNAPIEAICSEYDISRKHLNHLFKEYVGVSPKFLSSLHRLQRILMAMSTAKPDKLTEFSYDWEYFDQAHFNNDFKRFTGVTPTEYVKLVQTIPSLRIIPHFIPKHFSEEAG